MGDRSHSLSNSLGTQLLVVLDAFAIVFDEFVTRLAVLPFDGQLHPTEKGLDEWPGNRLGAFAVFSDQSLAGFFAKPADQRIFNREYVSATSRIALAGTAADKLIVDPPAFVPFSANDV